MAFVSASFLLVLRKILPAGDAYPDGAIHLESPYYRNNPAGVVHGGYDFFYTHESGLNGNGHPPVYSPVAGTVIYAGGSENMVAIRDQNGFIHRILHLDPVYGTNGNLVPWVTVGQRISVGDYVGDMGNFSEWSNGGSSGNIGRHIHYDILAPGSVPNDITKLNKIDPQIYWTPGVNPHAPVDANGRPTGTGLTVLVVPINDFDGNGTIDSGPGTISENGAVVREGERSLLRLGVNTPHTQPIVLRLAFSQEPPAGFGLTGYNGVTVVQDPNVSRFYYVTLPATPVANGQSIPNTSGFIELFAPQDDNTTNEQLNYSVEAGYFSIPNNPGSFVSYNHATGDLTNVFTPVTDQSLIILDNDLPPTPDPALPVLVGTELDDARLVDPDLAGLSGGMALYFDHYVDQDNAEGTTPAYRPWLDHGYGSTPIGVTALYRDVSGVPGPNDLVGAIYGLAGDDFIRGNRGGAVRQLIDGGEGSDWIIADYEWAVPSSLPAPGDFGVTVLGGGGHDAVLGTWRNDFLNGGSGHDQLFGWNGADRIEGGTGNDWLAGDIANTVDGQPEGEFVAFIDPASHTDVLIGGPETSGAESDNDTLLGGYGADYLAGGAGNDTLYGDANGGLFRNFIFTRANTTSYDIWGWNGATETHHLPLNTRPTDPNTPTALPWWRPQHAQLALITDVSAPFAGDDQLSGGIGDDRLFGGARNDILDGGDNNDFLYGEAGNDNKIHRRVTEFAEKCVTFQRRIQRTRRPIGHGREKYLGRAETVSHL